MTVHKTKNEYNGTGKYNTGVVWFKFSPEEPHCTFCERMCENNFIDYQNFDAGKHIFICEKCVDKYGNGLMVDILNVKRSIEREDQRRREETNT